jgi:hypothetical protein
MGIGGGGKGGKGAGKGGGKGRGLGGITGGIGNLLGGLPIVGGMFGQGPYGAMGGMPGMLGSSMGMLGQGMGMFPGMMGNMMNPLLGKSQKGMGQGMGQGKGHGMREVGNGWSNNPWASTNQGGGGIGSQIHDVNPSGGGNNPPSAPGPSPTMPQPSGGGGHSFQPSGYSPNPSFGNPFMQSSGPANRDFPGQQAYSQTNTFGPGQYWGPDPRVNR